MKTTYAAYSKQPMQHIVSNPPPPPPLPRPLVYTISRTQLRQNIAIRSSGFYFGYKENNKIQ